VRLHIPTGKDLIEAGEFSHSEIVNQTEHSVINHLYGVFEEVYVPFFAGLRKADGTRRSIMQSNERRYEGFQKEDLVPEVPDLSQRLFVSRSMFPTAIWVPGDGEDSITVVTVGLVRLMFHFAARLALCANRLLDGGMWPRASVRPAAPRAHWRKVGSTTPRRCRNQLRREMISAGSDL
jgi:hypothetical protein